MVTWLTKLGVGNDIRSLFGIADQAIFDYGDSLEEFARGSLKVPVTKNIWRCGNEMAANVVVTWSAAEAMAMLTSRPQMNSFDNIQVLSIGCRYSPGQTAWMRANLKGRKFVLLFPDDIAGRATDIAVAAGIRNIPLRQKWERGILRINCRNREFCLPAGELSLASFERAAGVRSHIRTLKPTDSNTFLEQLYEQQ